jgi:hypothetical protein
MHYTTSLLAISAVTLLAVNSAPIPKPAPSPDNEKAYWDNEVEEIAEDVEENLIRSTNKFLDAKLDLQNAAEGTEKEDAEKALRAADGERLAAIDGALERPHMHDISFHLGIRIPETPLSL